MVSRFFFNEMIKDLLDNLYDIASLETHPALFSRNQASTRVHWKQG